MDPDRKITEKSVSVSILLISPGTNWVYPLNLTSVQKLKRKHLSSTVKFLRLYYCKVYLLLLSESMSSSSLEISYKIFVLKKIKLIKPRKVGKRGNRTAEKNFITWRIRSLFTPLCCLLITSSNKLSSR